MGVGMVGEVSQAPTLKVNNIESRDYALPPFCAWYVALGKNREGAYTRDPTTSL